MVGQEEHGLMGHLVRGHCKGKSWAKPGALETFATRSNTDSQTSALILQRKSHFCLPGGNPRIKHLEKVSTI